MIYLVNEFGVMGRFSRKRAREIRSSHSKSFVYALKASRAAHDLMPHLKPKQFDTQSILVSTLFVRGLTQYQAALLLFKNALPNEASIVLRAFLELVIYLRAIQKDISLANAYIAQHDRERLRLIGKIRKSSHLWPQFTETDLAKEESDILRKIGGQKKGPTLSEYAKAAGLEYMHDVVYPVLCDPVHTGVHGLQDHLDAKTPENVKSIRYGLSDDKLDALLGASTSLLLIAIETAASHFSVSLPSKTQTLFREFEAHAKSLKDE